MGDGAQILDQLVARHTDARVGHGQRAGFCVKVDVDRQFGIRVEDVTVGQHLELDAVQRVGGVRDQLPQKDLAVGVQRIGKDVEQLLDFSTEIQRFLFSVLFSHCPFLLAHFT